MGQSVYYLEITFVAFILLFKLKNNLVEQCLLPRNNFVAFILFFKLKKTYKNGHFCQRSVMLSGLPSVCSNHEVSSVSVTQVCYICDSAHLAYVRDSTLNSYLDIQPVQTSLHHATPLNPPPFNTGDNPRHLSAT